MTPPIASQAPRAASAVPADRHRLLLEGGDARKPEPRKRRMAQRGSTFPLSSGRGGDADWKNPITLSLSGWGEGTTRPLIRKRVAHQHRVVALGTGGEQGHGRFDQFFDAADVLDRQRVELRPGAGAARTLVPAFYRLVDRLALGLNGGACRQVMQYLAAPAIGGANLDLGEGVEHVELGERDAGDAAYLHRLAHHDRVEPAAAPFAPSDDAELAAALAQLLARRVLELGRKRAVADAGGISLA